jgi:hypothetical protein
VKASPSSALPADHPLAEKLQMIRALLYLARLRFLLLESDSGVHGLASESGGLRFKSLRVAAFALAQRLSQSQFCAYQSTDRRSLRDGRHSLYAVAETAYR